MLRKSGNLSAKEWRKSPEERGRMPECANLNLLKSNGDRAASFTSRKEWYAWEKLPVQFEHIFDWERRYFVCVCGTDRCWHCNHFATQRAQYTPSLLPPHQLPRYFNFSMLSVNVAFARGAIHSVCIWIDGPIQTPDIDDLQYKSIGSRAFMINIRPFPWADTVVRSLLAFYLFVVTRWARAFAILVDVAVGEKKERDKRGRGSERNRREILLLS